ncbi:MAG TPA: oligopeptide:H+ symporter [Caulobacteraceae bacterium]|nr:oligopeptide:H+ symporter [Caulobacteraceae bacterium]
MIDVVIVAVALITVLTAVPVFLQLRRHPRGLAVLFFAEMWERFSFYGMRGLLIFYLTEHFLFGDSVAQGQYAAYSTLVYLVPLVGGYVADRWLGSRKAIAFGALLLVAGHFTMAIEGPAASQSLAFGGHVYHFRLHGRMQTRQVCLEVGRGCYGVGAAPGGVLAIQGLPASAPLPAVLAKGSYAETTTRSPGFVGVLYLALSLIIMGVGFLKANISSIVGQLYGERDPRRDPGFTLYYYGINLGAVWASAVCGALGQSVSWSAGFGLAGVGMLAGYLVFVLNKPRLEGRGEPPDPKALARRVFGPVSGEWLIYLAALAGVGVVWLLVGRYALMGWMLAASWALALAYLGWEMSRLDKVGRERLMLALVLIAGSVVFFTLFEQAGSSMNQFAERNTALPHHGFWTITPAQTQTFNAGFILILAPGFAWVWARLGRAGRDPDPLVKFGLGLLQVGAGFFVLVWGAHFANAAFRTPVIFLAMAYLLHTTGELSLSPVGLSQMTKLSPARMISTVMALWFLAASASEWLAGRIAQLTASATVGGQVLDPARALATYSRTFLGIGLAGAAAGVLFLALSPFLKHWSHGADDPSPRPRPEPIAPTPDGERRAVNPAAVRSDLSV